MNQVGTISLAGGVILDQQGRLLVLHRSDPSRTQWELPGGKIDPGETPEAAATRELVEELGVTVEIVGKLGERAFEEDGHRMHYHWFRAVPAGVPGIFEPNKFDSLKYFSWDELGCRDDLSPNLRNLTEALSKGEVRA